MTREAGSSNVRAAERALQILGSFDHRHPERGTSEIAKTVGLHKATTCRIVTTLASYGYLERAGDGQRYRLGTWLARLGFLPAGGGDREARWTWGTLRALPCRRGSQRMSAGCQRGLRRASSRASAGWDEQTQVA